MSLNQYKNSELIFNNISQVIGNRFNKTHYDLLTPTPVNSTFGMFNNSKPIVGDEYDYSNSIDKVELHAYSLSGDYLNSNYEIKDWIVFYRKEEIVDTKIRLNIHNDIRSMGFRQGEYKFVYNFLRNYIGSQQSVQKLFIWKISQSRTEIILRLTHPDDEILLSQLKSFSTHNSVNTDIYKEYILNFGENKLLKIINAIQISNNELLLKLYEPLPLDIEENFQCWLCAEILNPVIDNVILYPTVDVKTSNTLKGPNFDVDVDYWTVSETDLKNWNDLLGDNAITSQKLIDNYFSGSLSGMKLNIQYNEFDNFIHFSSATERVNNFVYKLNLIETYDSELSLLDTVTGSVAGNVINTVKKRNSVISGFDDFEKYLYFQATGSLYTYPGSSSVEPFPKVPTVIENVTQFTWEDAYQSWYEANILFSGNQNTVIPASYPYSLYSVSSSAAIDWINNTLSIANEYDKNNIHSLVKTIPEHIRMDESNSNYELFVNMFGHHFDILWSYINAMTDINTRENHPSDGMSSELLYDVAKGYGWTLTHGNQVDELWKYTFGTDESGVLEQSGSVGIRTKSSNQRTKEVWRRIVNNLPYILKSKGTSRSVKALLSCYGIPNSALVIREYGGPSQYDETPNYNYTKYERTTNFTGTEYLKIPWKKIQTETTSSIPSSLTLRIKPHSGLDYKYGSIGKTSILNSRVGSNDNFGINFEPTASNNEKGTLNFYLSGSNGYLTASIQGEYILDGRPFLLSINRLKTNDSINENQIYTFEYRKSDGNNIIGYASSSLTVSGSLGAVSESYNNSWIENSDLYIGSSSDFGNMFSGSLSEIRMWSNELSSSALDAHSLSARSYRGNSESASYYDLGLRIPLTDNRVNYSLTQSIISNHPNFNITTYLDGTPLSASLFGFTSESLVNNIYEYTTNTPSIGANSLYSDKIRIDNNELYGRLSSNNKAEKSEYRKAPIDSNRVAVAFSPQNIINEDIFEHMGHFNIDNFIGDPSNINKSEYPNLKNLSKEYWKKYSDKNNYVDYIRLISLFDFSMFQQVKQVIPLRANKLLGLLIEPSVLERNKVNSQLAVNLIENLHLDFEILRPDMISISGSHNKISGDAIEWTDIEHILGSYHKQSGSLNLDLGESLTAFTNKYSSSLNITRLITSGEYIGNVSGSYCGEFINNNYSNSSKYKLINIFKVSGSLQDIGYGYGYITQSNSVDSYYPLSDIVTDNHSNKYYSELQYFYSSSVSASIGNFYSSSLIPNNSPNPNGLTLGVKRHRYLGSKLSGQDINVNSDNTVDGGPVVESYDTPGNELYTKDYDISGSLKVN